MRILVLGGTAFVGRAVTRAAIAAGDDVVCAARGRSGPVAAGAGWIPLDRDDPGGYATVAASGPYDAVVDVSSRPSFVRAALAALAGHTTHWVYVSSGSVYADAATPGQRAAGAPTVPPAPPEIDDPAAPDNYGPCKVACERAVLEAMDPDHAFICRAGLIVGPEDASGRFTYWPVRLARGGEVLAPGGPEEPVQWIDVRDLAAWLVSVARSRVAGAFDGIGPAVPRAAFLAGIGAGVGVPGPELTWVEQAFLVEREVAPWAGPRSVPLWLPVPEYAGFLSRDVTASIEAGLACRDVAGTAAATIAWQRSTLGAVVTGLTAAEEAEVLAAWHRR